IKNNLHKNNHRINHKHIMLHDLNDKEKHARELSTLLADHRHLAYVNLIPYNSVDEHDQSRRSETATIQKFHETLKKRGIASGVRWEQGADIDAACGQLRSKQMKKAE